MAVQHSYRSVALIAAAILAVLAGGYFLFVKASVALILVDVIRGLLLMVLSIL